MYPIAIVFFCSSFLLIFRFLFCHLSFPLSNVLNSDSFWFSTWPPPFYAFLKKTSRPSKNDPSSEIFSFKRFVAGLLELQGKLISCSGLGFLLNFCATRFQWALLFFSGSVHLFLFPLPVVGATFPFAWVVGRSIGRVFFLYRRTISCRLSAGRFTLNFFRCIFILLPCLCWFGLSRLLHHPFFNSHLCVWVCYFLFFPSWIYVA